MSRDELTEKLNHLDPGAILTVEAGVLAQAFGAASLNQETMAAVEAFALEHRCTFLYDPVGGQRPIFEKDDIF